MKRNRNTSTALVAPNQNKSGVRQPRQPYTEKQRSDAPTEFARRCMELADFDSNEKGGAQKWREMHRALIDIAPPAKRARFVEVSKIFKSNTLIRHRIPLDELIKELQDEHNSLPSESSQACEDVPVPRPHTEADDPQLSCAEPRLSAVLASHTSSENDSSSGLHRFFARSGIPSCKEATRGKGPPASTKASSPSAPCGDPDPEGYYKVLELSPAASAGEIRAAYLQRILQVHPDKGGTSAEFILVNKAFNVLSDSEERAKYDGKETAEPETSETGSGTSDKAKTALATLLVNNSPEAWCYLVASMTSETLEAAAALLQSQKGDDAAAPDEPEVAPESKQESKVKASTGLLRQANGAWKVKAGWRNFYMETPVPIKSLERASRVLAAATHIREVARARHRAFLQSLSKNGCSAPANAVDECPPLLQSELFRLLSMEPCLWYFASDMQRKPRIMSPFTPSLNLSLEFRSLIRRVQDKAKECLFREELDKNARAWMKQRAVQDRAERTQLDQQLLECMNKQLAECGQQRGSPEVARSTLTNDCATPAIQDAVAAAASSFASELAIAHRAVLVEVSSELQQERAEMLKRYREAMQQEEEGRMKLEGLQAKLQETLAKQEEQQRILQEVLIKTEVQQEERRCLQETAEQRAAAAGLCARREGEEQLAALRKEKEELQDEILKYQRQLARCEADRAARRPWSIPLWPSPIDRVAAEARQFENLREISNAAYAKVLPARERAWKLATSA